MVRTATERFVLLYSVSSVYSRSVYAVCMGAVALPTSVEQFTNAYRSGAVTLFTEYDIF